MRWERESKNTPLQCQPSLSSALQNVTCPSLGPRPHHLGGLPASWDTTCQADGRSEISRPTPHHPGTWMAQKQQKSQNPPAPLSGDPRKNKGAPPKVRRRDGASMALCHMFLGGP